MDGHLFFAIGDCGGKGAHFAGEDRVAFAHIRHVGLIWVHMATQRQNGEAERHICLPNQIPHRIHRSYPTASREDPLIANSN